MGSGVGGVGREKVCLQMTNTVKLLFSKEHNTEENIFLSTINIFLCMFLKVHNIYIIRVLFIIFLFHNKIYSSIVSCVLIF